MMIKNISNLLLWGGALAGGGGGSGGGGGGGGDTPSGGEEWIGDGNTHIWVSVEEGRTSPVLGCCPKGTVTVDWGDGSTPDVLTGSSTSTVKWTPTHNYATAGDYVITLTVDGEMGIGGVNAANQGSYILRHSSSSSKQNNAYRKAIKKIEIGNSITKIGDAAFDNCYNLTSIKIPDGVRSIGEYAFHYCHSLTSIEIPNGVTSIGANAFRYCYSLASVTIPDSVTSIPNHVFSECRSLKNVIIPSSVTSIGNSTFYYCYSLGNVTLPNSITSIGTWVFRDCYNLTSIKIPDGVTSIGEYTFYNCYGLANVTIPSSVASIGSDAFYQCYGVAFYDFTHHTTVPTLAHTKVFYGLPDDCEIRVPAALVDEWKAATNWSTYADYIVGV